MAICADCRAAPGGICPEHLIPTSFDAPTEEEKRIAELEARCSRLERENLDLRPIVEQERDRANRAEAKAEEQGRTAVSLFDELKRAQAVIAKLDGRIAELEAQVDQVGKHSRELLAQDDAKIAELQAQLAALAEPVLVDGPHGRPEDDALVRHLRENRAGKVRAKELIPLAEAGLRARRVMAGRMAEQAMRIQALEGELQRAREPAVLLLKRDQADPEVLAQVRAVRQSFRAAFVESAIEVITNQPRAKLEDLGELEAEIRRSVEANASRPIGTCPKCQRPVYIEGGFCGGCTP